MIVKFNPSIFQKAGRVTQQEGQFLVLRSPPALLLFHPGLTVTLWLSKALQDGLQLFVWYWGLRFGVLALITGGAWFLAHPKLPSMVFQSNTQTRAHSLALPSVSWQTIR